MNSVSILVAGDAAPNIAGACGVDQQCRRRQSKKEEDENIKSENLLHRCVFEVVWFVGSVDSLMRECAFYERGVGCSSDS